MFIYISEILVYKIPSSRNMIDFYSAEFNWVKSVNRRTHLRDYQTAS